MVQMRTGGGSKNMDGTEHSSVNLLQKSDVYHLVVGVGLEDDQLRKCPISSEILTTDSYNPAGMYGECEHVAGPGHRRRTVPGVQVSHRRRSQLAGVAVDGSNNYIVVDEGKG